MTEKIGCVLYTKGKEEGTLDAKWYSTTGKGTGKATGGSSIGFEGHYNIRYFDEKGNFQAERGLEIKKVEDYFELLWFNNGEVSDKGIGMEVTEGLVAGYHSK